MACLVATLAALAIYGTGMSPPIVVIAALLIIGLLHIHAHARAMAGPVQPINAELAVEAAPWLITSTTHTRKAVVRVQGNVPCRRECDRSGAAVMWEPSICLTDTGVCLCCWIYSATALLP
eukprot:4531717-Amphidinium_carterae.1